MDFIQLCEEVGTWSTYNFGDQPPDNPLTGVLEEIGELAHAHLKMSQGIRGTPKEHMAALRDGVADAVIFLADFCYRADIVKSFVGREMLNRPLGDNNFTFHYSNPRRYLFDAARNLSRIFNYWDGQEKISYGIHIETVLLDLKSFCAYMQIDFGEAVEVTWEKVKKRDWRKNAQTGGE